MTNYKLDPPNLSLPLNSHPDFTNFSQLVNKNADDFPHETAFQFRDNKQLNTITYQRFREDIHALGTYLCRQGMYRTKIAVIGENSYEWILTYFAVVMSDNIVVPVDKELALDDIAHLLDFSDAELLIYTDSYSDVAEAMLCGGHVKMAISTNKFPSILEMSDRSVIPTDENALCTIIFTSGTTGKPKGVMLSQRNMVIDAVSGCKNVYFSGPSLLTLPLHHTFAFTAGILVMLVYHVPIYINKSLRTFQSDMQLFQPQNMFLVPLYVETMYKNIWKAAKSQGKDKFLKCMIVISNLTRKLGIDLRRRIFRSVLNSFGGNLDLIVSGGASIKQEYIDGLDDIGILVLNGYGITECAPVVAVNRNKSFKPNSIGLPLVCNEIKIDDGEICVRGDNVMLGYYRDENSTHKAMDDDWFRTGDLGCIDEDGFVYITGRKKNLIILSNGKNVSPEELEDKLLELSNVLEVVVSAKNGVLVAEIYAERQEGIQKSVMNLNKSLPHYQQIQRVLLRSTPFEKTTTKKIKRGS